MKKDYDKVNVKIDKKKNIVQIKITNMEKLVRERLSDKILNDEPIEMVFFEM